MKQCVRCNRWFTATDSRTCDPCWEDMGQMTLDLEAEDGFDRHPIDTIFDRDRQAQGRDW